MRITSQRGFTLPELIATVFAACLIVTVSAFLLRPLSLTKQTHDAQRWNDVAQIIQGINRYVAATGNLPDSITGSTATIGNTRGESDLCKELVPQYLKTMPLDPATGLDLSASDCASTDSLYDSGYTIAKTGDRTVVVSAPHAESGAKISLTRTY